MRSGPAGACWHNVAGIDHHSLTAMAADQRQVGARRQGAVGPITIADKRCLGPRCSCPCGTRGASNRACRSRPWCLGRPPAAAPRHRKLWPEFIYQLWDMPHPSWTGCETLLPTRGSFGGNTAAVPLKWEGTMMRFSEKPRRSGGLYLIVTIVLVLVVLDLVVVTATLAPLG